MKLSERLPSDVINLIIEVYDKSIIDKQPNAATEEILDLLPPASVQNLILFEIGIIENINESVKRDALEWVRHSEEVQTRAEQTLSKLYEAESLDQSQARMGKLPGWIVEPWSSFLNFPWSRRLEESVLQADEYLENRRSNSRV